MNGWKRLKATSRQEPLLAPLRDKFKELTPFAVSFRYPGEEITAEEVRGAVNMMKSLRIILRRRLGLQD